MFTEEELKNIEGNAKGARHYNPNQIENCLTSLISDIRTLQQQNKQLIEENERLMNVEADYKALQDVIERARRLAFITAHEEEEERPRFKMDVNGNLTRI